MDRVIRRRIFAICLVGSSVTQSVAAQSAQSTADTELGLRARPDTCVALHRGQTCYQKVHLSWQVPRHRDVCLYRSSQEAPVSCWMGMDNRSTTLRYVSETSEHFRLQDSQTDTVLVQITVTTSWLYEGGRRSASGWRLF